jgi:hypothetical protein
VVALVAAAGPAAGASTGWGAVNVPTGGQSATLLGVSATSDSDAWAVGSVASGQTLVGNRALIEHRIGTAWQQSAAPMLPTNGVDTLTAVSAASATDAWAVGNARVNHSSFTPLTLHWNGTSWSNVTPVPKFLATLPNGVADFGPSDAYLIANDSSQASGLLEHWNGSAWSLVGLPDPDPAHPGLNTKFDSIAATSPSDVWVMGSHLQEFSASLERWEPYALHFDGSVWSVVAMPQLPGTDNQLTETLGGLAALAPDDVWAVGGESDTSAPFTTPASTFIEHWNGTAWTVVASPSLGSFPTLTGVAARSASDIWAVGTHIPAGSTVRQTLTEHFDGTSWTVQPSPTSSAGSVFAAASTVPGTNTVLAVGSTGSSSAPAPLAAQNG